MNIFSQLTAAFAAIVILTSPAIAFVAPSCDEFFQTMDFEFDAAPNTYVTMETGHVLPVTMLTPGVFASFSAHDSEIGVSYSGAVSCNGANATKLSFGINSSL